MNPPLNDYPDETVMLDVPTDILCSYHYFRESDLGQMQSWGTRIIGDSGAFSAETSGKPIDREAFHEWADRWRDALLWGASLDVIGDQEATRVNWKAAQRDGLDLVPSLHYPADPKALDWYAEQGVSLVGLGGMVAYSSEPHRLMRWLLTVFRYQRDNHPDMRFHGWGISHPLMMDNLPWWSADSSGFTSAFRFGTMRLFDVPKGKFVSVQLNGSDMREHAPMLRRYYDGIDWRKVSRSVPGNRRDVGRVSLKALQHYGRWLRQRQLVTPPRLLLDRVQNGGPGAAAVMGYPGTAQWRAIEPAGGPVPIAVMSHPGSAQSRAIEPVPGVMAADVKWQGPLTVAADTNWQAPSSPIDPGHGPHPVGAVGRAGSGTSGIHPEDKTTAPIAAPLVAGAPASAQVGEKYLARTGDPTNVGSPSGVLDSLYATNTTGGTPA